MKRFVTIFTLLALRSLMNAEWAKTGSAESYDDGSLLDDNGSEIKRVNARTGYPSWGRALASADILSELLSGRDKTLMVFPFRRQIRKYFSEKVR